MTAKVRKAPEGAQPAKVTKRPLTRYDVQLLQRALIDIKGVRRGAVLTPVGDGILFEIVDTLEQFINGVSLRD